MNHLSRGYITFLVEKSEKQTASTNIVDVAKEKDTEQQKDDNAKLLEVLEKISEPEKQITEAEQVINNFLGNPSLDSFRVFCDRAKNIRSSQTKEVLSADRTRLETVNKTLFEVVSSCRYLNDPNSGVFFTPNLESLLVHLDSTDTDSIRIKKINYNNQIKELDHQYKVYSYKPCGVTSLNAFFKYVFDTVGTDNSRHICIGTLIKSIKMPEIEIRDILKNER